MKIYYMRYIKNVGFVEHHPSEFDCRVNRWCSYIFIFEKLRKLKTVFGWGKMGNDGKGQKQNRG